MTLCFPGEEEAEPERELAKEDPRERQEDVDAILCAPELADVTRASDPASGDANEKSSRRVDT